MGIEAGKGVTKHIERFLEDARAKGHKVTPRDDGSFELSVEQSVGAIGVGSLLGRSEARLSLESSQLLRAVVLRSEGHMRVRAYRRGGWPSVQAGQATLELSDPKTRLGLEVVVDDADGVAPDVSTSLPRTFDIQSSDPVVHVLTGLMKDRIEKTQINDALGVIALARLALGLGD